MKLIPDNLYQITLKLRYLSYFEFIGIMFDLLESLVMMPLVGMGCKNSTG